MKNLFATMLMEKKTRVVDQLAQRAAEIAELKEQMLHMKNVSEERMWRMEVALAEVLRNQSSEHPTGSTD